MKLIDYMKKLSYGELSNLFIGNDGRGTLEPNDIPMVVSYINDGLLRLYTRFVLDAKTLLLECNEVKTRYHLHSKHSWLNATEADKKNPEFSDKYILDDPEHPFIDDLIKILDVFDSLGHKVPLNSHSEPFSVFTPVFDVIELSHPIEGLALAVTYQARHPILDYERNPEQEINLPDSLYEALSSYIAYQYYGNLNTQEAVANSQKYFSNYQRIIQEVVEQDLVSSSYSEANTKFRKFGWI